MQIYLLEETLKLISLTMYPTDSLPRINLTNLALNVLHI